MTPAEADARITLSRRVLNGWEAGGANGKPKDLLRMVGGAIAALEAIALEHPVKAAKVAALIGDWEKFRAGVKGTAH